MSIFSTFNNLSYLANLLNPITRLSGRYPIDTWNKQISLQRDSSFWHMQWCCL